jgi:hypothetical protein
METVNDLKQVWSESKIHDLYDAHYRKFIGYLDEHNLNHWQKSKERSTADYYEKSLGINLTDGKSGKIAVLQSTHGLNRRRVKILLLKAKVRTSFRRALTRVKKAIKALIKRQDGEVRRA